MNLICEVHTADTFLTIGFKEAALKVSQLLPELFFAFNISTDAVPLPDPVLLLPLCLNANVREVVDDGVIGNVGINAGTA